MNTNAATSRTHLRVPRNMLKVIKSAQYHIKGIITLYHQSPKWLHHLLRNKIMEITTNHQLSVKSLRTTVITTTSWVDAMNKRPLEVAIPIFDRFAHLHKVFEHQTLAILNLPLDKLGNASQTLMPTHAVSAKTSSPFISQTEQQTCTHMTIHMHP